MIQLKHTDMAGAQVLMKDAVSLSPFEGGVEYASPARGPWNIVHIGTLVPESHEIFMCAQSCLRGVVLTAAEMGEKAMDRFSTIVIQERNILRGDLEELMIEGVTDILNKLPYRPRAVEVFNSCIHDFIGCDLDFVFGRLRQRFPDVDFTDCYMTPVLRKTRFAPDAKMRQQLYTFLKPAPVEKKSVNVIGNLTGFQEPCELVSMIREGGWKLRDICACQTYGQYQKMAGSSVNIVTNPGALSAGQALEERLGQQLLYLPLSYDYEEIDRNMEAAAETMELPLPDLADLRRRAEAALEQLAEQLGGMAVALDFNATVRPLGLARLLLSHGIRVVTVYGDSFIPAEEADFQWLKAHAPELKLRSTVHGKMAAMPRDEAAEYDGRLLAVGQKAAYFSGTEYFVNMLEGSGLYGYEGMIRLARWMAEGAETRQDVPSIIQVKGWGCCI